MNDLDLLKSSQLKQIVCYNLFGNFTPKDVKTRMLPSKSLFRVIHMLMKSKYNHFQFCISNNQLSVDLRNKLRWVYDPIQFKMTDQWHQIQ